MKKKPQRRRAVRRRGIIPPHGWRAQVMWILQIGELKLHAKNAWIVVTQVAPRVFNVGAFSAAWPENVRSETPANIERATSAVLDNHAHELIAIVSARTKAAGFKRAIKMAERWAAKWRKGHVMKDCGCGPITR